MSENENLEQEAMAAAKQEESKPAKVEKAGKAEKSKKDQKPEKKKPGVFARIGKWLRELKAELKKVQWPTGKQVMNNTLIVIICCVVVGICIWVFDALAGGVVSALLNLFKG